MHRIHAHPSHDKSGWEGGKTIASGNFRFMHDWPFSETTALLQCLHCKKWERRHLNEMNSDNQGEEIDYYYQMALQRDYRPRLPITAQPQLPRPETGWFPSLKYENRPDVHWKDKWVIFEVMEVSKIQQNLLKDGLKLFIILNKSYMQTACRTQRSLQAEQRKSWCNVSITFKRGFGESPRRLDLILLQLSRCHSNLL